MAKRIHAYAVSARDEAERRIFLEAARKVQSDLGLRTLSEAIVLMVVRYDPTLRAWTELAAKEHEKPEG